MEPQESPGLTMLQIADMLGVSDRTIRRYIRKYRAAIGPVREGIVDIRGCQVAFRQLPGVRNVEYRFRLILDKVLGDQPGSEDATRSIFERLDAMEASLAALIERVDHLEREKGP